MKVKNIEKMGFQLIVKDPFVVTFHHRDLFPPGNANMEPIFDRSTKNIGEDFDHNADWRMYYGDTVPGFPVHPHRGFETITVMTSGFADHFDSKGSKGRYGEGDVQWMTAGSGIQHSEMFPVLSETENTLMELFQIWLNLPKKNKFATPDYKMFWNEQIPIVEVKDANGCITNVKIIAGSYKNTLSIDPLPASWAYDRNNHVNIWLLEMEANAEFTLPAISPTLNRMLYFYEGSEMVIEDKDLLVKHCAELNGNESILIKNGKLPCKLLLLEGEPINEPTTAYGPFVMNTKAELQEAFDDYQRTQFGGWPWESTGPVNAKDDDRFANYENGSKIEKP